MEIGHGAAEPEKVGAFGRLCGPALGGHVVRILRAPARPFGPRPFRHPVDDLLQDLLSTKGDLDRFASRCAEGIKQLIDRRPERLFAAVFAVGAVGAMLSWLLLALASLAGALFYVVRRRRLRLRARAGCVPVRVLPGGRLQVLLIRSRKHPESYIFPAGGVEPGETAAQAAARETIEEAGVTGSLGRSLGEIVGDGKSRTVVYALHVDAELERWQEDWRPREWFDLGVPGSPGAKQAASRVQRALLPKPVVQETYRRLEAAAAELAKEGEQAEQRVRNAGTPPTSRDSSRRRAKKAS